MTSQKTAAKETKKYATPVQFSLAILTGLLFSDVTNQACKKVTGQLSVALEL